MPYPNGGCELAPDEHARPRERVLHLLDVREGPTGEGVDAGSQVGVAVDVETTGLDMERDEIIQLAIRRFRYDDEGVITHIGQTHEWVEDPGKQIPADITELTGLTDADVAWQAIDDNEATRLLCSASIVIAHHSRFDRRWVERRLEHARGLPWACSMEQIAWRAEGFDGRGLGYLLCQAGWYHEGHRASADVDAVIQLLRRRFQDGRTALAALLDRSSCPSWLVRAVGADFEVKDLLRGRGYRWDPRRKVWWTEVQDADRLAEEIWLARNVYTAAARPKALGPSFDEITATTRFL